MTTAQGDSDETADDTDLTAAVHQVLTSLTRVRRGAPPSPEQLRDRLELVRWLRRELAEVEALLVGRTGRPTPASAPPTPAR